MERYQEYKDSGEKWLGEIPSHWEMKRLGSYFNERKSKVSDKDYAPLSVTKKGILPQLENVAKSNDSDNRKQVCAGDFVINSRSDRKGSSGVSLLEGSVSLINIVLQPRKSIYSPFCNYLLKSNAFIEEYYRNGRGIVADLWTTRYDEMKSIKLAVPPLSEQTAMVSYLDRITAQIDKAIAQQQRMIDLLNERKQIIIQHAVTKGLDPNAEMVDSGVKWIGEMPKGWNIIKLKYCCSVKGRVGWNGLNSDEFEEESFAYLVTGQDFKGDNIEWEKCYQINKRRYEEDPYIQLKNGDILITKDGTLGKIAKVQGLEKPACLNSGIFLLKQTKGLYTQDFLYWMLLSNVLKEFNNYTQTGATILHLYQNVFINMPCIVPNIEEQRHIALYLNTHCAVIDKDINKHETLIKALRERKQIIINEVVTGKVKVS